MNVQEVVAIVCLLIVGIGAFLIYEATEPKATATHDWPLREARIFVNACEKAGTNHEACVCMRQALDGEVSLKALAERRPIANQALREAVDACVEARVH